MKQFRIVIVEDEDATARHLAHLLHCIDESFVLAGPLHSVSESVAWFRDHPGDYDLVFMDIRLADGMSFGVFKQVVISKPVIFVTAYEDHALEAFRNNGIGYVLKPFGLSDMQAALDQYRRFFLPESPTEAFPGMDALLRQLEEKSRSYKSSFLVHHRDKLIPVPTSRIAWFYTAHDLVYAMTEDGRQYLLECTMEQLGRELDPHQFFRANRQFIVQRAMISAVDFYYNGRLRLQVRPEPPSPVVISKARATEFKSWMNS